MPEEQEQVSFPWMMLSVAVIFDLLGLVPFLNILTEIIASLIFGLWQAIYAPKINPIITIIVAKIIDTLSLGFLPSNIGIVVFAYLKKKAANRTANIAAVKSAKTAAKNKGTGAVVKNIAKTAVKAAA